MTPARRVFVLLGVYEDLTERESRALRRGDVSFAIALENRKRRMVQAMATARRNAELSQADLSIIGERVRIVEARQRENLEYLRQEMLRVRADIAELGRTTTRTRSVRRGYASGSHPNAEKKLELGCA
ncbi:hypothetical protein ASA1KI_08750 [Opitutales bacterium ASA1]|uniref:hypothetical protein n=1 Tax=Congregicoccus parvus TaxID=3081749 RepID=UPI002B297644|nr:hypothetical protein ASA1KI_08750 [Opitutales bacterium ASA1]